MIAQALLNRMSRIRELKSLSHVAALMSGAVVAQAVPVALSPVLTRLYTPEDFAALAIFMSISGVIAVIGAGRYDEAILLPAHEEDAFNVVALSWAVLVALCVVLALMVGLFQDHIPATWTQTLQSDWLPLLPLTVFASASFQILGNWNNRCARFNQLAVSRAAQGVSGGTAQCGLGYVSLQGMGLIWGWLIGQLCGMAVLLYSNLQSLRHGMKHLSPARIVANAKLYRRFPLLSTWGCLMGSGGSMMALLIISQAFSATITGFFSFTLRVLALPLFMISHAIAQVLHQRVARLNNEAPSEILGYILRTAAVLGVIAVPFVIVLALFGVDLFTFVFGKNWAEAGRYAGLLSLAVGIRFIVSPLTVVLSLDQNVKSCVQWQALYFCSVTATLGLGSGLPIDDFLKLYVAHELVLYSIYFMIIIKAAQRRPEV